MLCNFYFFLSVSYVSFTAGNPAFSISDREFLKWSAPPESSASFPDGNSIPQTEKSAGRVARSLFDKFSFLTGYKVGSSIPAQTSGQLVATHNGNFLGKFMNANIRLVYGSQPLIGSTLSTPPIGKEPVKTLSPEVAASNLVDDRMTPSLIYITTKKSSAENSSKEGEKQGSDDKISVVESIIIPVYESVHTVRDPVDPWTIQSTPGATNSKGPLIPGEALPDSVAGTTDADVEVVGSTTEAPKTRKKGKSIFQNFE